MRRSHIVSAVVITIASGVGCNKPQSASDICAAAQAKKIIDGCENSEARLVNPPLESKTITIKFAGQIAYSIELDRYATEEALEKQILANKETWRQSRLDASNLSFSKSRKRLLLASIGMINAERAREVDDKITEFRKLIESD